ncbi:MAG: hypothetical protein D6698_06465 [Gammaproteobacteria bacterium]|nr:MAG: hypothetical protein D6698_06465 [Gammaproteobacteria bacterium]
MLIIDFHPIKIEAHHLCPPCLLHEECWPEAVEDENARLKFADIMESCNYLIPFKRYFKMLL